MFSGVLLPLLLEHNGQGFLSSPSPQYILHLPEGLLSLLRGRWIQTTLASVSHLTMLYFKEIILAEIGPISLIRGPTGSHLLSIMRTTLLPKTNITGDNSNPRRLSTVAVKHETETENTAFLWGINSQNISKGDRLKPWEGNWNISLLNVLTYTGPYEKETWVLSDITHSTWSWDLSHCG